MNAQKKEAATDLQIEALPIQNGDSKAAAAKQQQQQEQQQPPFPQPVVTLSSGQRRDKTGHATTHFCVQKTGMPPHTKANSNDNSKGHECPPSLSERVARGHLQKQAQREKHSETTSTEH